MNATDHIVGTARWLEGKKVRQETISPALLSCALYEADPVRTGNRYPRQTNVHGYYPMSSTERHVWFESRTEMRALMLLDYLGTVVQIASQPVELKFAGMTRFPDFLALHDDGVQRVFDVKPRSLITAKVRTQFEATREVCDKVGWEYSVLTELPAQVAVNLEFLYAFRHPAHRPSPQDLQCLPDDIQTLSDLVRAMPSQVLGIARAQAMHLLWTRDYHVDLHERLTPHSPVRAAESVKLEVLNGQH